jgi:hypothetical protein
MGLVSPTLSSTGTMQLVAPFPLTPALSPGRGSTVGRFGLEEPFGGGDRSRRKEQKAGSPRRSTRALHRVGLNCSGPGGEGEDWRRLPGDRPLIQWSAGLKRTQTGGKPPPDWDSRA